MAAATALASVRCGSKRTTARPRARFTLHSPTPLSFRAALSTCATQLAQSIPLTASVASCSDFSAVADIASLYATGCTIIGRMSSARTVQAVIFDLDGTLADTFPLIVAAWNAAVTPHTGITYSDADVIARFGIPDPFMIRRDLPGDAGELADQVYHSFYEREHAALVKPFAGVNEMLAALRQRGVPMGLMPGKGRRTARMTVDALGWRQTFAAIVTGEDVKEQKPRPEGPLMAAKMLGVQPEHCAFVGDSPADIGAGQAAGMVAVAAGWHPVYLDKI